MAAALMVAALVTYGMANGKESKLSELCSDRSPCDLTDPSEEGRSRAIALQGSRDSLATATSVLWISGALLAAGGAVWFLVERGEQEQPSVTAHVTPSSAGLMLRGTL